MSNVLDVVTGSVAGFFTFQATIFMFHHVCSAVGIHNATPLLSTVVFLSTVATGNLFATLTFTSVIQIIDQECDLNPFNDFDSLFVTCLIIITVFLLLGNKNASILPSHVMYAGAFSRGYVIVDNKGVNPSPGMKQKVQQLGRMYGCHHCGTFVDKYISDHMPPTKLALPGEVQRLYPQCNDCSMFQGGSISNGYSYSILAKKCLVKYTWRFRWYFVWLPYFLLIENNKTASCWFDELWDIIFD